MKILHLSEGNGPYRLGRHVEHDQRSLRFAHGVLPSSALKPVQWTRRIDILDQGRVGSCTGNALTGVLGTDSAGRTATTSVIVKADTKGVFKAGTYALDEKFAVLAYTLNTKLDSIHGDYPAEDTGSTGIACGKSGQQLGLLSGYTHAFSLDALKSALQSGPAMVGIVWLNSMFDPQSDGTLSVDRGSGVAGGHELVVSGWDGSRFRLDNSWSTSWGDAGSCWVKEPDMQWLLSQAGDVTVPTYAVSPAPTPTPVPTDPDMVMALAARAWLTEKGL